MSGSSKTIALGALAEPLAKQLGVLGVPRMKALEFQRLADAITLLKVCGIITDRDGTRARNRLMKRIAETLP